MKNLDKLAQILYLLITCALFVSFCLITIRKEEVHKIKVIKEDTVIKKSEWKRFIDALIDVESRGIEDIVGDGGRAIGVLQIHPIMVKEANRVLGYDEFTLEDRYSRVRSIHIFESIQAYHNPEKDIDKALKIWNPGAGYTYKNKVKSKLCMVH